MKRAGAQVFNLGGTAARESDQRLAGFGLEQSYVCVPLAAEKQAPYLASHRLVSLSSRHHNLEVLASAVAKVE